MTEDRGQRKETEDMGQRPRTWDSCYLVIFVVSLG